MAGRIAGRIGRISVSNDAGVTFNNVNGLVDGTFNGNQDELDASAHDDGQFRRYISGRKDATVDMTLHWEEGDVGQEIISDAFFSATALVVRFRMQEMTGKKEIEAGAIVTSYTPTMPNDDMADIDVTLRISGDFTASLQP